MSQKIHEEIYDKYVTVHFGKLQNIDIAASLEFYELNFGDILPKNKNAKILDIGVGLGHFLYFLKKKSFQNISGVDISKEAAEYVNNNFGIPVLLVENTVDFLSTRKNEFDIIFCLDVLEHISKKEHITFLKAIRDALRERGHLILKTDNMSSPIGAYQQYMDFTHEYCYVELSLKQVLSTVGFSHFTIRGERYNFGKSPKGLILWVLQKMWFSVLRLLFRLERGCNDPTIFSKSLVAICEK